MVATLCCSGLQVCTVVSGSVGAVFPRLSAQDVWQLNSCLSFPVRIFEIASMTTAPASQETALTEGFTSAELDQFQRQGFIVLRELADVESLTRMRHVTREHLAREVAPIEFEADLNYPGAPETFDAPGGRTVRRLKQAHARDIVFTDWVCGTPLMRRLNQILGPQVAMPFAHHNCVMTKTPEHSSDTGWHQDIRYWSYQRPELVSVWLALGPEHSENGGLWVIPGSHSVSLEPARFDAELFLREDLPENRDLIDSAVPVELNTGDVLFFHARTLHSASRNHTSDMKCSVVFTFRPLDNPPLPGSRSASAGELLLPCADP